MKEDEGMGWWRGKPSKIKKERGHNHISKIVDRLLCSIESAIESTSFCMKCTALDICEAHA